MALGHTTELTPGDQIFDRLGGFSFRDELDEVDALGRLGYRRPALARIQSRQRLSVIR